MVQSKGTPAYSVSCFACWYTAMGPVKSSKVIYFMSITRGVLAQSPEQEAHDKVLDNNPDQIGIWKFWFLSREENRNTLFFYKNV